MKALIIAAGKGSRLKGLTDSKPKPLIQLLGLSLIERVILTAKQAGIDEFVIVTGYLGKKVKEKLGRGDRYGIKITYVENREWKKGNAVSVLKAKKLLNENFVLLTSDNIFDVRILKGLIAHGTGSSVILAVDRRQLGDTKVLAKNGRIANIGRNIKKSNRADTGIFLCSPKLFSYIEEAVKKGKTELADGIALAAKNRDAETFDITRIESYAFTLRKNIKPWWIDIDTEGDLSRAKKYLIKSVQKRNHFAAYYNAPFENKITSFISKYHLITPNRVSIITFILAFCVTFIFLTGYLLLASVLTFFVSVLDGVDGKLARLKHMETKSGKLEHSFDSLWETSWIIAFSLALSSILGSLPLFLGLVILPFDFFNRHIFMQFQLIVGDLRNQSRFDRIFCLIDGRRNTYLWYILIGVLLNRPIYSLIAILFHAIITSVVYTIRMLQHTGRLDRKSSSKS